MVQRLVLLVTFALFSVPRTEARARPDAGPMLEITADWVIHVPAASHPALLRAGKDLQAFLRERHGLVLRISERPEGHRIELVSVPQPDVDRFSIRTAPAEQSIRVESTSPRGVYQGVLYLEDILATAPALPASTLKSVTMPFRDRYLLWNVLLTGQNKGAIGFDLERHVREAVRLGYTGMECNRFVGMDLPQQGHPRDPYPWYTYWGPSMDQFVTSPLFAGVFPADYLARNLADLKQVAGLVESFGLKPIFVGYEPRFVPEAFLARHADLRGPRVDHPLRSMANRYSLCTDRPDVLAHYRVLAKRLVEEVPALAEMHVIFNDSGTGFCWDDGLYPGRNGPAFCRNIGTGDRMQRFFGAIQEGFRSAGRNIPVVAQPHGTSRRVMEEFFSAVPKEVAFTAGNWPSWSLGYQDPLGVDRFVLSRARQTGRRTLYYQQHFTGFDVAPTLEYPLPFYLAERLKRALDLDLDALNTLGGIVSPPIKERSAMQEVLRRFLLDPGLSVEDLVARTARDLGGDEGAKLLIESWRELHAVTEANGRNIGFAMGTEYAARRTLVRPLVPDAAELLPEERDWWQAYTFGGDLRYGHAHLFRGEGGLPGDEWYRLNRQRADRAAKAFLGAASKLEAFLSGRPGESRSHPYLRAHARQLRLLGHIYTTGANLYEGQGILDKYSRKAIEDDYRKTVDADLSRFQELVLMEIENTEALRRFLSEGGDIGMALLPRETTWGYGPNLPELLRRKCDVMRRRLPEARSVLLRWFDSEY